MISIQPQANTVDDTNKPTANTIDEPNTTTASQMQ